MIATAETTEKGKLAINKNKTQETQGRSRETQQRGQRMARTESAITHFGNIPKSLRNQYEDKYD